MNAAEILVAVEQAGATLRVEGGSLVASNASRIAPAIKTAIRENKPQIITMLGAGRPACRVTIVELPAGGLRYRRIFARLQLKPPALVDLARWQQAIADGRVFLRQWGEAAQRLNWSSADIFGLTRGRHRMVLRLRPLVAPQHHRRSCKIHSRAQYPRQASVPPLPR